MIECIIIDKDSYLPYQFIRKNLANEDMVKTTFTKIITDIPNKKDLFWYYSSYLNDYKILKENSQSLVKVNSKAIEWELPDATTGQLISSKNFKDKIMLIEFYINNYGYCISAVKDLNFFNNQYKNIN